ncbi:MAG TPA: dihydrodipicolinate synthase family protein [Actinopolymorphaceae bacterium]
MASPLLRGVIPPVCTPLTADLEVDTESLRRLVDFLLDAGVDGLFVLGSSSEAAFLPDEHRRTVTRTVVDRAAGRVPVIAGVIDMTTLRVLSHVEDAVAIGVDGLVVTAPFYTRTHPAEIEQHFRLVAARASGVPVYAYDIPVGVNGVKLSGEMLLRLAADGVLAGVKDSSGDEAGFRRLLLGRSAAGLDRFSVLTGSELMVDAAMRNGADGVVPGLGNVDPVGYVRLLEHCAAGDWDAARAEQDRLVRLFGLADVGDPERMGRGSSAIGAFKGALRLRGIIADGRPAPPAIPLTAAELDEVRGFLVAADLL